jgi:Ca-activated chloride channel family protein
MIQFADPKMLWLLTLLPVLVSWYTWKHLRLQTALQLSSLEQVANIPPSATVWLRHSLFLFRIIAFAALVAAIARPQITLTKETIATEGIDLVIAFDISGSMLAKDFVPNRLEAAKKVAEDFVNGRPNDRIGVVFFAAEAYTGCPHHH